MQRTFSAILAALLLLPAFVPVARAAEPAVETVNVDLARDESPFVLRGTGFVRALAVSEPTDDVMAPLKPRLFRQPLGDARDKYAALRVYPRAKALGAKVHVVLGQGFRTDAASGGFPGDGGKWERWEKHVTDTARAVKEAGLDVAWEVWPEPNNPGSWRPIREQFYAAWVRAYRAIRAVDPKATIVGPGNTWDYGWLETFLKTAREWSAVPDVIYWVEKTPRADLKRRYDDVENILWQDGHGLRPMHAQLTVASPFEHSPAAVVFFLASLHRSPIDSASRRNGGEHGYQLGQVLTEAMEPRSTWHAYKLYADLEGTGHLVKVTKSSTADGLATFDATTGTARVLVARAKSFSRPSTQPIAMPPVEVKVGPLPGRSARVTVLALPRSGKAAAPAPAVVLDEVRNLSGGQLTVRLPRLDDHGVALVTIGAQPAPAAPRR